MTDVIDHGSGPVVILLHGAGVDNHLWDPQISELGKSYRVIAPNLPGHGSVPAAESVEKMADFVHAQLKERGIDRYAVVGLSLGGMVALELAARKPNDVSHLVIIEAVPTVTDNRAARLLARILINLFRIVPPKLLAMLPGRSMGAETADAATYTKSAIAKMTARDTYAVMRAALAYNGRPHLSRIMIPAMVMVGEKNKATHRRAKEMSYALGNCQFRVIPNAGHIANRDAVDFTNDAINSALNGKLSPKQV